MKPHIRFKSIAAGVTAAVMITAVTATNAAADTIGSSRRGTYHEIDNNDAFVTFNESEVILVAYYYNSGYSKMYIRDVITDFSISNIGSSNVTLRKDKVRCCTSDGTYLEDDTAGYCSNFVSQGKFESTSEFTAHGKTYCK